MNKTPPSPSQRRFQWIQKRLLLGIKVRLHNDVSAVPIKRAANNFSGMVVGLIPHTRRQPNAGLTACCAYKGYHQPSSIQNITQSKSSLPYLQMQCIFPLRPWHKTAQPVFNLDALHGFFWKGPGARETGYPKIWLTGKGGLRKSF